jgi:hypothetical protein
VARGKSPQPSRERRRSLDRASADELENTRIIDGERAHRIGDYPNRRGNFTDWDQVKDVPGIDDGIVARLLSLFSRPTTRQSRRASGPTLRLPSANGRARQPLRRQANVGSNDHRRTRLQRRAKMCNNV